MSLKSMYVLIISFLLPILSYCQILSQAPSVETGLKIKNISITKINELKTTNYPLVIDLSKIDFQSKIKEIKNELRAGPGSGGGGNTCALMIKENTQILLRHLQSFDLIASQQEHYKQIRYKIENAKFLAGENLNIDGKKVQAINYPGENVIVVDSSFCEQMIHQSAKTIAILLHEYLGLALIDDTSYQISSAFMSVFSSSAIDLTRSKIKIEQNSDISSCPKFFGQYDATQLSSSFENFRFLDALSLKTKFPEIYSNTNQKQEINFEITIDAQNKQIIFKSGLKSVNFILDGKEHYITYEPKFANYYEKYTAGCIDQKVIIFYESFDNGQKNVDPNINSADITDNLVRYKSFFETSKLEYTDALIRDSKKIDITVRNQIVNEQTKLKTESSYSATIDPL